MFGLETIGQWGEFVAIIISLVTLYIVVIRARSEKFATAASVSSELVEGSSSLIVPLNNRIKELEDSRENCRLHRKTTLELMIALRDHSRETYEMIDKVVKVTKENEH